MLNINRSGKKQERRYFHIFVAIVIFSGLAPRAYGKGGYFFDLNANYMISKLERASAAASSFSLLSSAGMAIDLKMGMMMGKSFSTYLGATSYTQNFIGPSSRTIENADSAPARMHLGFSWIAKDVEMFINFGSQDYLAFRDIAATTHAIEKIAISTASLGMALSATSKSKFSLDAEASIGGGLAPVEFNGDPITLNSSLAGTLRIMFGKNIRYGVLATMHIDEYKNSTDTYTGTDFYGGMFSTFIF